MTAYSLADDRELCLAAGMNDYLAKPVQANVLAQVLERWLTGRDEQRQVQTPEPMAEKDLDAEDLLDRVMGNRQLACRVVRRFVSGAPRQLAVLSEALQVSDAAAARMAAHALRGAAASAGGTRLASTARRIEAMGEAGDLTGADELAIQLVAQFDAFRAQAEDL
jgi:two-component system sensor histidine kinase/response regulator